MNRRALARAIRIDWYSSKERSAARATLNRSYSLAAFSGDMLAGQPPMRKSISGVPMSRLGVLSLCVFALAATALSSFAADRILFDRLGPTQAALFISNADGSAERPLTQPGSLDYNPSWSPKGDWIAFTSERAGSADLFRIHPDGTGLERLTDDPAFDDQAAFSPDGARIVFVSTRAAGRANLWILDVVTHKATPLTSGNGGDFRPSWSPDGAWIAFSSDRDSNFPPAKGRWERLHLVDIYLIHPDGTGLKRISQHGGFCGSPKWATDSKSVVTDCMSAQDTWTQRFGYGEGDDELVKIDIAGGAATPVAAGPGVKLLPTLLSSGEVAYLRRDKAEHGVFYSSGKPGPKGSDLRSPSWSPDGARVVYSRYSSNHTAEPVKVWSRNPNFDMYSTTWLPAYDPSGEHLAVTKMSPDGATTTLLIVDEGKPARSILQQKDLILGPSWSPDGKQIVVGVGNFTAFLDDEAGAKKPIDSINGGAQVAIVNADGSGFHLVTSGNSNNAFASFGPDGKHIVYRTTGPDGDGLRIMNLDDRSIKVLTSEWDNFPIWSPRGDLIAFIRRNGADFEVFTIHPDGTGLKQLTHTHGNDAHLAWSPDGERLLFCSSRMGFKDEVVLIGAPQPYGEVFVMRYDGTQVEQLTDNQWEEGGPAWQPHKPMLANRTASTPLRPIAP
jgi:Tol biopolymer transport system component